MWYALLEVRKGLRRHLAIAEKYDRWALAVKASQQVLQVDDTLGSAETGSTSYTASSRLGEAKGWLDAPLPLKPA